MAGHMLLIFLCFGLGAQSKSTLQLNAGGAFIQMRSDLTAATFSKLRFIGRWYSENNAMKHSWGTGTFMMKFQGSASIGVNLQSPSYQSPHYYVCQVDGGEDLRLAHSSGALMIADGLSLDEHIVKCGRSSEASYGVTIFTGVVLESGGELLPLTTAFSELRYEAIGDSITAGFKVTGMASEQASPENEDVFKTYERYIADAWGTSDWRVVAKSGISILPYAGGAEKVMELEWPCRTFWAEWQGSCPTEWDFNLWQADVVTINLGTNDFAFGDASRVTKSNFQKGYKDLVMLVRQKYPQALIACIQPLQYSCGGGAAKLDAIVEGLEATVQEMQQGGDSKVRYYRTGTIASPWLDCQTHYSDYTHPTVEGSQIFAEKLLETLTDELRFFFPEKCGGSGPRCERGLVESTTSSSSATSTTTSRWSASTTSSSVPSLSSTTSTAPGTSLTTAGSSETCVARPQSALPSGSWATTDSYCAQCSSGYAYWPCDTDPPLCNCSPGSSGPGPAPLPTSTLAPSPATTPAPEPGTLNCVASPQSALPSGSWATTDSYCAQCSSGYAYWPCDTDPPLCDCSPGSDMPVPAPLPTSTLAPWPATTPSPEPGTLNCVARLQSALPSGSWATTDASCAVCANGYQWWPCEQEPALCNCSSD